LLENRLYTENLTDSVVVFSVVFLILFKNKNKSDLFYYDDNDDMNFLYILFPVH